jgi:hypothetical protein
MRISREEVARSIPAKIAKKQQAEYTLVASVHGSVCLDFPY